MPKDPTRNIERYKIGGSHLNEFEFHKNQGELTEQDEHAADSLIPGSSTDSRAERVARVMAEAHEKVKKRNKIAAKANGSRHSTKGRVAKKTAKIGGKKRSSGKTAGKKAVSKKSSRHTTEK
jgi:hypothetical protein